MSTNYVNDRVVIVTTEREAQDFAQFQTERARKVAGFLSALDGTAPQCKADDKTRQALNAIFDKVVRPHLNGG